MDIKNRTVQRKRRLNRFEKSAALNLYQCENHLPTPKVSYSETPLNDPESNTEERPPSTDPPHQGFVLQFHHPPPL